MDVQTVFEQALALDQRGEIEAAVACLDEALERIPDHPAYLKFAGQLYQRLGADRQSLPLLERALALAPDDAEIHFSLGCHYVDNGAPERAVGFFRRHLDLAPASAAGQLYLGRALDWVGRLDEAEPALERAVALDPKAVEPYLQLGRVRLRRGKLDAARQAFEEATLRKPDSVLAEIGQRRVDAVAAANRTVAPSAIAETVVCVKAGTKYGPAYVNRLAAMVRRNTSRDIRFVCFTDDAHGLDAGIAAQPLPGADLNGWWNKVALFKEALPGVAGRVLYLDLDVVIVGALDPLLERPGRLVIMDNDYVPGFNSSVMLFDIGAYPRIWSEFTPEAAARIYGDQDWIALQAPDAYVWPEGWCVPYRLRAAIAPPPETKVVVFSGRPNPDEYPAEWIRDYWR